KASDLYLTHMSPDRAGEMLEKGARALEPVNVDNAIEMYVSACSLFESEERGKFAIDTFRKAVAVMIKNKSRYITSTQCNEVEAKKQFQLHAFVQSEESAIACALLDAFEQGDQELVSQIVRKQTVTFLDNEIAKLARGLQVP
ncbi:23366_t:CDS:2, partial [Gigaspora rosea]